MVDAQSASPRHPIFTALFGMMVLTLGMGVGRFLYTPMLPVMLAEKQLTFNELSWIASANYAGYLAGSLLFSFGLFHLPSRLRPMLLASAFATGILILAMAIFTQPAIVMLVRFLAGVASAGMMIFGSMIVLHHTRHPFVIAALFSGVGAGIALGNEYVIGGLHYALSAHSLWLGAGALAGILLLIVAMLIPPPRSCAAACALSKNRKSAYALVATGAVVRFRRIRLHHCRYLFAADGEKRGLSATHGAPLVVGRPGDHSRLLRLAVGGKTLGCPAMPDREPVDPERLRAAVSRQRLVVAVNTEQYWFWRHVYGHNLAGDAASPTTQRAGQY